MITQEELIKSFEEFELSVDNLHLEDLEDPDNDIETIEDFEEELRELTRIISSRPKPEKSGKIIL